MNKISGDWHRNQYIFTASNLDTVLPDWNKDELFDEFAIYAHKSINVASVCVNNKKIAIIGVLIDPLRQKVREEELARELLICNDQEALTKMLQDFTGRFVVVFKTEHVFTINTDTCAFRQIYYGTHEGHNIFVSNPKLFLDAFGLTLEMGDEKREIVENKEFQRWESPWFGSTSYDDRLTHLLPNKYYDLKIGKEVREKVFIPQFKTEQDLIAYSEAVIKGGIQGYLARNTNVIQAITAGWDSRIALASIKDCLDEIKFFILDLKDKPKDIKPDQYVSRNLCKKLGIELLTDDTPSFEESFKEIFGKNHIFPRWDTKIRNIQWHHQHTYNWINVNTNALEIARVVYNKKTEEATPAFFASTFHLPHSEFVLDEFSSWKKEAEHYAEDTSINLFDLFFWEQRQGNWGALNANEKDIAVDDLTPFNNKSLLLAWLQVPKQRRQYMNYTFFKKLIKYMWKDVLVEPINPEPTMTYIKYYLGVVPRRIILGN